jgi:hypothetical protein
MTVTVEQIDAMRNGDPVVDRLVDRYIASLVNAEATRQIMAQIRAEIPDLSQAERWDLCRRRLAAPRAPMGRA